MCRFRCYVLSAVAQPQSVHARALAVLPRHGLAMLALSPPVGAELAAPVQGIRRCQAAEQNDLLCSAKRRRLNARAPLFQSRSGSGLAPCRNRESSSGRARIRSNMGPVGRKQSIATSRAKAKIAPKAKPQAKRGGAKKLARAAPPSSKTAPVRKKAKVAAESPEPEPDDDEDDAADAASAEEEEAPDLEGEEDPNRPLVSFRGVSMPPCPCVCINGTSPKKAQVSQKRLWLVVTSFDRQRMRGGSEQLPGSGTQVVHRIVPRPPPSGLPLAQLFSQGGTIEVLHVSAHGCAHCKRTAPQEEKEEDEAEDAEESEGGGPNGQREDDWPVSESESEEQRAGTATPTPLPPSGPDPVGTNKAGHTERSQSGAAKQDRAKRSTIILVCCICKRNSNEEA